ncbi:Protein angel 1 [Chytriomyces hyalinus]|nr:Protein angel 1 [Chytriomyces hyalinus]
MHVRHRRWKLKDRRKGFHDCFTLMTYNVLSDTLAQRHPQLYSHSSNSDMRWRNRAEVILRDIEYLAPDVLCLQEVEPRAFETVFQSRLGRLGYTGRYCRRLGDAVDGCALFYKHNVFALRHAEDLDFKSVTGKDNVAIIAVFDLIEHSSTPLSYSSSSNSTRSSTSSVNSSGSNLQPSSSTRSVCVATTHLLFNTKRGLLKLAQLHSLTQRCQQLASRYNTLYSTVICGDMNMTEESAMYHYMLAGETEPFLLNENFISGQIRMSSSQPDTPYSILEHRRRSRVELVSAPGEPGSNQFAHEPVCFMGNSLDPVYSLLGSKTGLVRHGFYFRDAVLGLDRDSGYNGIGYCAGELDRYYSTWHSASQALVDFIFHSDMHSSDTGQPPSAADSKSRLAVKQVLELPRRTDGIAPRMPSHSVPSDHVPLMVQFAFV